MYQSQTPIDIHCSKIVDWLIQRRHCKKDWGENLASIRLKMKTALCDMPEHEEIKQILVGSKLDYFKSKRIVEILRDTEADTKNFFGYYSSQRMKDWQDIVRLYEKDCLYMAELATDLIRETNYEIPGTKKMLTKFKQERDDAEKEKNNLRRRAQQFASEHSKLAQSYGINGIDIVNELHEKSKNLQSVMNQIAELSCDLQGAIKFYRNHAESTSNELIASSESNVLTILDYIIQHGNTTVYEWKYGEKPTSIEIPDKPGSSSDDIDLGEEEDEIDFGDEPASSESSSGFVHLEPQASDDGDKNAKENSTDETFIKLESETQKTNSNDKIARGDDAKMVLQHRQSRCAFLNNLYELESFLDQLIVNLSQAEDKTSSFLTESSTRTNQLGIDELNAGKSKIQSILAIFNQPNNKILFQMNDSALFVNDIKEKLESKLRQSADNEARADVVLQQIGDLDTQIHQMEIHLKKCITKTRELQDKIQSCLKDLYGGRPINIMGCMS